MIEGLLIIWVSAGSQWATMSATRYPTIEACEAARAAILTDKWVKGWLRRDEVHCVKVVPQMSTNH